MEKENQDQITSSLKNQLNETVAEKIALDQAYCEEIRAKVILKKEAVLLNQKIQNLSGEISSLKAEKDSLLQQVKDLKSSLDVLRPEVVVQLEDTLHT